MAEEQNNTSASQIANNVKEGAKLAKDTARLAAGDVTAIKDVLLNKYVIGVILGFVLIISLVGMCIGASINGVINYIAASWEENWEENWTDQGIASEGNLTYLQTQGWILTLGNTISDVISDVYNALTSEGIAAGAGTSDNQQIQDDDVQTAGKNPDASDYTTTMQAILDSVKLDQALTDRLDMIKGRVKQRGIQIEKALLLQYVIGKTDEYNMIANALAGDQNSALQIDSDGTAILYAGLNETLSGENVNLDMSAFELTSLQALKILAIFSIQHDCQLTEMDMWTLMDYCGWYVDGTDGEIKDTPDSIYEITYQSQQYGNDIGSAAQKNQGIPIATYEFPTLKVPIWTGTCAPQWYYEELAQIRKHNEEYIQHVENGNTPDDMIYWGTDAFAAQPGTYYTLPSSQVASGYTIDLPNSQIVYAYTYYLYQDGQTLVQTITDPPDGQDLTFTDLLPGTSYTISRIYTRQKVNNDGTKENMYYLENLVVGSFTTDAAADRANATENIDIDRFNHLKKVETYGIIDRLFYGAENNVTINRSEYFSAADWTREEIAALGDDIYDYWEKYIWSTSKLTITGSSVTRDDAGIHSYTYSGTISEPITYTLPNPLNGEVTVIENVYSLALYDSENNVIATKEYGATDMGFTGLSGNTTYTLYQVTTITTTKYDKEGTLLSTETTEGMNWSLDLFTTFEDVQAAMAYELYVSVNLSYKARTVDEIAFDLLGIWPGSLDNTTQVVRTTKSGNLVGKTTNETSQYSYCLLGGVLDLKDTTGHRFTAEALNGCYSTTMRASSAIEADSPLTTIKTVFEYGIADSAGLSGVDSTPIGGWRTVTANGEHLIFDISGNEDYLVYLRVSTIKEVLNSNGTVTSTTVKDLYLIDEIRPMGGIGVTRDTYVQNGTIYAAEHLGNENLQLNWNEKFYDDDGVSHQLIFTRMSGYQYEAYVDTVMALCELLEIPYDDWDPAIKRAQELNLTTGN